MGKIRKFLGFLAFLCVCTFGANAFADPETINLHWVPGYGNEMVDTTCEFGGTFSVPTAPEVTGRVIASWSVNGHVIAYNQQNVPCDFDTLGVTSGTTTLQGRYEPVQYDIIYHSNGGGIRPDNPDTYDIDTDVYLGPIVREHSYFSGWYDNPNFSGYEIDYIPLGTTGQIDLYAKWECEENYNDTTDINSCVPNTYNVNFSCGAGTGTPPAAKVATYADVLLTPANTCSRSGWIFDGWSVSGTDDIKKENFGFTWMYTESKTLTAHWIQTPGNCARGKYYDSATSSCQTCPSGYTSDLGAEGISKCYTTCQTLCEHEVASDMPEYVLSNKFSNVTYDFSAMVDGIKYYGSAECKTDILCPYINVACQGNTFSPVGRYYTGVTDFYNEFGEKNTNICALCPIEYPYSLLGNDTPITNCFQYHAFDCATDPDLTKDPLATCELELNNVTGVVYYPNEINDANTKKYKQQCRWVLPCSCPSGYTASLTEAKCNPNVYTITLDDTAGSGGVGTIYEKYATGFVLNQNSDNYMTSITTPTLVNKVFFGYWSAQTGGTKVIDEHGVLPSAYKFTESVTLYARWVDELFDCTASKPAEAEPNEICAPGYYCPGETVVKIERFDEATGCQVKCPVSDVANTTVTSPSGSTSITQCYSTTAGVELTDGNGGGKLVCNHDNDSEGDYENDSCQDIEITYCNAGYYKSAEDPTKCVKTDEGYWSPAPSDTTNGDPASIQQYSCSSLTGAINATTGGKGAQAPTECYNVCTAKTISNGTTVADNAKAYYNGSAYNLCTYTATCNVGYTPTGNGTNNPTCTPASYTVTYSCGLGTGTAPNSGTATYLASFTPVGNTGCTRTGYTFAGWSDGTATRNPNEAFTWNYTTGKELVAQWLPNMYRITLSDGADANTNGAPATLYMKYDNGWYTDYGATQSITALTQRPTRSGYEFAGYKYNSTQVIDADGRFVNNSFAAVDTTIDAAWNAGRIQCPSGYYYAGYGSQCTECLPNAFCPGGRYEMDTGETAGATACPPGGKTDGSASAITDCYNNNSTPYTDANHGSGTQSCYYNPVTEAYDICTKNTITQCDAGYYYNADLTSATNPDCTPVGPGYYSPEGSLIRMQCPASHPLSFGDATQDIYHCYAETCPMAENAKLMSGRNYYDTTLDGYCAIRFCMPGYYIKNGACVPCGTGFYCDGTDGGVGDGSTQCPANGDAFTTWTSSNIMSTKAEDCYATCLQRDVTYGTAYPVTGKETVNYPDLCEFYGISETGNPCDADELANGNCVESACHGEFEMKNGVCSMCSRDANALTYEENGNCIVKTCKDGFHPNIYACVENKKDCKNLIPNATEAFTEWNFARNAFGTCTVSECADGYHISANACVLDDQTCTLPHGIGTHEWDTARGQWGPCIATSCDAGYTSDPDEKLPGSSEQCGECKNKYVNGEQAVSSYVQGCEIASCMYQGEKFALNGDRCEAICLANMWNHDDNLVSIGWNQSTKKCERTCKPGYIPY